MEMLESGGSAHVVPRFPEPRPLGPWEKAEGLQSPPHKAWCPHSTTMDSAKKVLLRQSLHRPPASPTNIPVPALGPGSCLQLWVT